MRWVRRNRPCRSRAAPEQSLQFPPAGGMRSADCYTARTIFHRVPKELLSKDGMYKSHAEAVNTGSTLRRGWSVGDAFVFSVSYGPARPEIVQVIGPQTCAFQLHSV